MLDIGEVVERSRFAPSALRYYEKKGLIESTGPVGLRRQFGGEVLEQLALISLGRAPGLGMPPRIRPT